MPAHRHAQRKRRLASQPSASPDESGHQASDRSDLGAPPSTELRSSAALIAFLLCLWGQSLLLFDWARRSVFHDAGSAHLVLVIPVFGGATLAALVAVLMRLRGRRPIGGGVTHALGLASGLLGLTAVALLSWLGPTVQEGGAASRRSLARKQLSKLAVALDQHLDQQGSYPIGFGAETLAAALAPEYLTEAFPLLDPWGSELQYQSLAAGDGYLLLSMGRDGVQDLTDDEYLTESTSRRATNDLVLITGRFIAGDRAVDPR